MPVVRAYKVTATVEFEMQEPFTHSEAVALAEGRLERLAKQADEPPLNGIMRVRTTAVTAEGH